MNAVFRCVSLQFTSAVQQFELFVSGHMYILANRPKREDVLQLALLLPDSSDVFRQATAMVSGDRKKSWFKWRYVHMGYAPDGAKRPMGARAHLLVMPAKFIFPPIE